MGRDMNEQRTDFELLRAFAREGDQAAFAALARRHVDLVYATALRKTEDPGAAEEVAQNVFLSLARKAWQFAPDNSLPAWLYRAALLESKDWLRSELRRRRREQTAAELATTMNTPDQEPALRALLPLLDEALLSLREKERAALLLRFFENQPLKEVGAALGVGEDAAQKRVASALQKLTAFFQRRGFKSATIAVTAAALQHTAVSAPATVAASVSQAAAQMAPPAVGGLLALASRWAGLTQVQTVAVCLALTAVPVTWELTHLRQPAVDAERSRAALASAQSELGNELMEIRRLRQFTSELDESLTQTQATAAQDAATRQQLEAWKKHLREVLTADNYRWPADSPFVRIPKSVLKQIDVRQPIAPPGVVRSEARELLGLAPEERQQFEAALEKHFGTVDSLTETVMVQTNAAGKVQVANTSFNIPSGVLASQAWLVPALGDRVQASAEELQSTLQDLLGPERWPLVKSKFVESSLRRVLNLDASQQAQALAVWLQQQNGKFTVGFGWSGKDQSFSSSDVALDLFLPGHAWPAGLPAEETPLAALSAADLSPVLTKQVQTWLEQQALSHLGKGNGQ
jgi:RNA polymerase sigma factor (sigma-70 family)